MTTGIRLLIFTRPANRARLTVCHRARTLAATMRVTPTLNQCMKFATHTYMWTASFQDIILASEQGTITQVTIGEKVYGSDYFGTAKSITVQDMQEPGWIIMAASALVFLVGSCMLCRSWRKSRMSPSMREPLVPSGGVTA